MSITTVTGISQVRTSSTTPPGSPSRFGTIAKTAAIGGVIGAVAAAGLSFIGPIPIIGGMFAPIAAAIGGAAGLVVGGLIGLLRSRGSSAPSGAKVGASTIQAPPPVPTGTQLPPPLPT
ncbi:MAG: hypothetical protein JWM98_445 [Thermoleophilia bacterium]|nr:hypothetical protein [Thermoleophilia bacterium]